MRMGVRVNHAWGMTETSPIGTMGARGPDWDDLSFEQQLDQVSKQGRVPFGVELRIVDDTGVVLPRDGVSAGRLEVRGPWVVKRYFRDDSGDCLDEGRSEEHTSELQSLMRIPYALFSLQQKTHHHL